MAALERVLTCHQVGSRVGTLWLTQKLCTFEKSPKKWLSYVGRNPLV